MPLNNTTIKYLEGVKLFLAPGGEGRLLGQRARVLFWKGRRWLPCLKILTTSDTILLTFFPWRHTHTRARAAVSVYWDQPVLKQSQAPGQPGLEQRWCSRQWQVPASG